MNSPSGFAYLLEFKHLFKQSGNKNALISASLAEWGIISVDVQENTVSYLRESVRKAECGNKSHQNANIISYLNKQISH